MCEHIVIHMYYISIICKIFVYITQYIKVQFLAMNLKVFWIVSIDKIMYGHDNVLTLQNFKY